MAYDPTAPLAPDTLTLGGHIFTMSYHRVRGVVREVSPLFRYVERRGHLRTVFTVNGKRVSQVVYNRLLDAAARVPCGFPQA